MKRVLQLKESDLVKGGKTWRDDFILRRIVKER
jgi:hypothetical protein